MADFRGKQIGNYRLIRLLGHGGFADVYLGEHIHLNTLAAIKLLHTQLTADDTNNFRREARTIANLRHPHIVRVLDFGVEDMMPFLVMEYASGGNMRQRYPKGTAIEAQNVISYVKQVASALQYAHNQGIVHRDIKPENILLGPNSEILLSDFGIALVTKSILEESRSQDAREAVGTVVYMAPEQYQGSSSPASDQYALGVMVYEWFCGKRPFEGTFPQIAKMHMLAPPPSLRERKSGIPADVEKMVFTALAKDPQQRFQSVQAFATALEQAFQANVPPAIPHVKQLQLSTDTSEKGRDSMEMALDGPMGLKVLGAEPVMIGRAADNQLVIDDPEVSAHHAKVYLTGEGYKIEDLGSINKTYVNGERLVPHQPRLLKQGDTILIWKTALTFVVSNAPVHDKRTVQGPDAPTAPADPAYLPPAQPARGLYESQYQVPVQPSYTPPVPSGYGIPGNSSPSWPGYLPALQPGAPSVPAVSPGGPPLSGAPGVPGISPGGPPSWPGYPPPLPTTPTVEPQRKRGLSRTAVVVIVLVVILLIAGSVAGVFALNKHTADLNAAATAAAIAQTQQADRNGTSTAVVIARTQVAATQTAVAVNQMYPFSTNLILNDPLTDNSKGFGWDTGFGCSFTAGAYHVSDAQANSFIPCFSGKTNFSNFTFQADMTIDQGDTSANATAAGGLVFASDSTGSNGYILYVDLNGFYLLGILRSGKVASKDVLKVGQSSSFRAGLNQPNTLSVVLYSGHILLYANSQLITCTSDSTYTSGGVGFISSRGQTKKTTDVAYSNAKIWQLTTPQLPC